MPTAAASRNEAYWRERLRGQGEIKNPPRVLKDGVVNVDAALDALGRGLAAAGRGIGLDKGWAANRANDVVSNIRGVESLIGLSAAQRAERNVAAGRGSWEDALDLAFIPGIDALVMKYAAKPLLRGALRVARPAARVVPKPVGKAARTAREALTTSRAPEGAASRGEGVSVPAPRLSPRQQAAADRHAVPVPVFRKVHPGSPFVSKEEGPFLHIKREGAQPTIVPEATTASIDEQRAMLRNPLINQPAQIAKDYTRENLGRGYDIDFPEPGTSLEKQSAIGRAYQMAAEDAPGYKQALFERYGYLYPEVVEAAKAQNYDQLTEAAYRHLNKETSRQFGTLPVEMKYHFGEGEYSKPSEMIGDVLGRGQLNVFRGGDPHPYLSDVDPDTGLTGNEMFRAVHDYFGHGIRGNTFRPGGEEIAYASHAQMMSPLAKLALLAETRGQNSLVNYSPLNADLIYDMNKVRDQIEELRSYDRMRGRPGESAGEIDELNARLRELGVKTEFAPQLPLLLPPEYIPANTKGGMPDYLQTISQPTFPTAPERAVHLSHTPGLTATDPSYYGTGHRGADWPLRGKAGSPENKTSFYLGEPGIVRPEAVVEKQAPYAYETQLSGLYDIGADPQRLVRLAQAHNLRKVRMGKDNDGAYIPDLMRLVREYGYTGIRNPSFYSTPGQAAADVFTPVESLIPISRGPDGYAEGGLV